jgi:hypothetical protein
VAAFFGQVQQQELATAHARVAAQQAEVQRQTGATADAGRVAARRHRECLAAQARLLETQEEKGRMVGELNDRKRGVLLPVFVLLG